MRSTTLERLLKDRAAKTPVVLVTDLASGAQALVYRRDVSGELSLDGDPLKPATAIAADALRRCRERGVLVLPAGPYGNIIRTLSPLMISDEDLETGISAVEQSVMEAAAEAQAA